MKVNVGTHTGNYTPTLRALDCLAGKPKNDQHSVAAWARECGCDDKTMRKAIDIAMRAGSMAALGADSRARIEKVAVEFEFKIDPEPMTRDEKRRAREACQAVVSLHETALGFVLADLNCARAFGDVSATPDFPVRSAPQGTIVGTGHAVRGTSQRLSSSLPSLDELPSLNELPQIPSLEELLGF